MENQALVKRRRLSFSFVKSSNEVNAATSPSPTKLDALTKAIEGVAPINTNEVR